MPSLQTDDGHARRQRAGRAASTWKPILTAVWFLLAVATPLCGHEVIDAILTKDKSKLEAACQRFPQLITTPDGRGRMPLAVAFEEAPRSMSLVLIQHGADPFTMTSTGNSVFFLWLMAQDLDALEVALKAGADPNHLENRYRPLDLALERDYADTVDLLLKYRVDPNLVFRSGLTLWQKFLEYSDPRMVTKARILAFLEIGADPKMLVSQGLNSSMKEVDFRGPINLFLATHGVKSITPADRTLPGGGYTFLYYLLACDDVPAVAALLASGNTASIADVGDGIHTAYTAAGSPQMVDALVAAGLDVNEADLNGQTAIFSDGARADPTTLELLFAHGANPRIRDNARHSALWYAKSRAAAAVMMAHGVELEPWEELAVYSDNHWLGDVYYAQRRSPLLFIWPLLMALLTLGSAYGLRRRQRRLKLAEAATVAAAEAADQAAQAQGMDLSWGGAVNRGLGLAQDKRWPERLEQRIARERPWLMPGLLGVGMAWCTFFGDTHLQALGYTVAILGLAVLMALCGLAAAVYSGLHQLRLTACTLGMFLSIGGIAGAVVISLWLLRLKIPILGYTWLGAAVCLLFCTIIFARLVGASMQLAHLKRIERRNKPKQSEEIEADGDWDRPNDSP